MKHLRNVLLSLLLSVLLSLNLVTPVFADDGPTKDAAIVMGDWLFLSYLFFFIGALTVFLVALKRGVFRKTEDAKYYILTINEPDYYTPEWAKEEEDEYAPSQ